MKTLFKPVGLPEIKIQYGAITGLHPERDVLRCLPESDKVKQSLITHQDALGIGAYEDGIFVGSLWFYRIEGRKGSPYAPPWSGWNCESESFKQLIWEVPDSAFPLLGLDCFHVGRTKALEEEDLNDESYYRRGIGSGLLKACIAWAEQRDYKSLVAASGMDALPEFNIWAGRLPMKTYLSHDFDVFWDLDTQAAIPGHLNNTTKSIKNDKLKLAMMIKIINN